MRRCGENAGRFTPKARRSVARLKHIVQSKQVAGHDKDLMFLSTHEEALRELLGDE